MTSEVKTKIKKKNPQKNQANPPRPHKQNSFKVKSNKHKNKSTYYSGFVVDRGTRSIRILLLLKAIAHRVIINIHLMENRRF